MIRRRRPLLRAAMVGGAGYAVGHHMSQRSQHEAQQDQQLNSLQDQQQGGSPQQQQGGSPQQQQGYPPQQQGGYPPQQQPYPQAPPPAPQPAQESDRVASLMKLKDLRDAGILTDEEFQAEKQRILSGP